MDAGVRFDTQIVGALPVITQYMERMGLAEHINAVVPWEGEVPLGTVVEALVANRLLEPKALFRVDHWAQSSGVAGYLGLEPGQLNDDRLGRSLERLAKHAEQIQTALVLTAIREFDLDVSQIHYDITSVELFGAYEADLAEGATPPTPQPTYGHTKSGRKNVKQIQLGLNVTGDGGVPMSHLPLDGNAAESRSHLDNLRCLRTLLPRKKLLYIADTKLDTAENLLTASVGGGEFLCGGTFSPYWKQLYLDHREELQPIDYYPKSQAQRPPEERDAYRGFELEDCLEGEVNGRQRKLKYRVLFVWSAGKARDEATTRERHLAKVREQFEKIEQTLNKFSLKTEAAIRRRLESARAKYAEGELFVYEITRNRQGLFSLTWHIDEEALKRRKLLEGVYLLKTNLTKTQSPFAATLAKYKEQIGVERRFHHLKGPLAVAPMFLKNPERIAGLLCILVWAMMVLALMERQVRHNLQGEPLYGLYPENRPSPSPTGPALLDCFGTLCIVIMSDRGAISRRLAQPTPIQRRLLTLLDIPPEDLRTFKRRCGM